MGSMLIVSGPPYTHC